MSYSLQQGTKIKMASVRRLFQTLASCKTATQMHVRQDIRWDNAVTLSTRSWQFRRISTHSPPCSIFHGRTAQQRWEIMNTSQRPYSQLPWLWPLGKIDQPKKKDFKEPTSTALVQVDPLSMTYLERIHDASTAAEVLTALQEGGRDITTIHYGSALTRLADIELELIHETAEKGLMTRTTAPVLYDSGFRDLCEVILQQSRHMDNGLFLDVLDALHKLKVPLKSSMMYTFLVQVEHRINTFNGAEIARLAGFLNRLNKHDPRIQALINAVGLLAPRHINDLTNIQHVLNLVNTVGTTVDNVSRGKLANMLLAILAANEERTLKEITQAVLALHHMDYKLNMLLELACPVLTHSIQDLSNKDVHRLLCALGGLRFPDQGFFHAAAERILETLTEWTIVSLINVLQAFSVTETRAPILFDSVLRRVMENGLKNVNLNYFTQLIESLVKADHRYRFLL